MSAMYGIGLTFNIVLAVSTEQTGTNTRWKTYIDDDGEFTIQYPAIYDLIEIHKTENDGTTINEVMFHLNKTSLYIVDVSKYNYQTHRINNDQDYDYHLKRWWNATTSKMSQSENDTHMVKPPEFNSYTLDGKRAGSIIITTNQDGKIYEVLQVGRILNNGDIVVTLGTSKQKFNQELPQMEHMIKSLRFTTEQYNFQNLD